MESDLLSKPVDNFDESETERNILNDIKTSCSEFMNKTINEYGCDILGIRREIRKSFLTNKQLEEYELNLKDFEIEIDADFSIRRIGMKI